MSANLANQSGQLVLRKDLQFNGVKVFSATMVADRDQLGEKVTAWINTHPEKKVTNLVVTHLRTKRSTASRSPSSTSKRSLAARSSGTTSRVR